MKASALCGVTKYTFAIVRLIFLNHSTRNVGKSNRGTVYVQGNVTLPPFKPATVEGVFKISVSEKNGTFRNKLLFPSQTCHGDLTKVRFTLIRTGYVQATHRGQSPIKIAHPQISVFQLSESWLLMEM